MFLMNERRVMEEVKMFVEMVAITLVIPAVMCFFAVAVATALIVA